MSGHIHTYTHAYTRCAHAHRGLITLAVRMRTECNNTRVCITCIFSSSFCYITLYIIVGAMCCMYEFPTLGAGS